VVVATLLDDQKSEALDSIKTVISNAITEIRTWDQADEAQRLVDGEMDNDSDSPRRSIGTH
jgi:hypothetical protein